MYTIALAVLLCVVGMLLMMTVTVTAIFPAHARQREVAGLTSFGGVMLVAVVLCMVSLALLRPLDLAWVYFATAFTTPILLAFFPALPRALGRRLRLWTR